MKTIEEYMRLKYRMELIPDEAEGGYTVRYPDLPGCLSCADTLEDAVRNAEDARREWFAAAMEEGIEIPEPSDAGDYSGQFKLRIPKSLHRDLAEHSREEGISMNQYCLYLLTKNDAAYRRSKA
jgi:predicted RNase H-like HicB family nuclease